VNGRRERLYRTEAIVLRRRDQGEADRVLTVFTPDMGKQQLLAKGVRKITSRKAGHVELFTHSQFLVAKARTWGIVTQAETIHAFRPLREDLLRTSYAYYAAELVDRFTQEGDENRRLFELLLAALGWLGEARDLRLLARFFELRLLALVGYRPQLFQCVRCQADIEPVDNFWSPAAGGVLCPRCGGGSVERSGNDCPSAEPLPLNALKVLRFLQTRDWETCSRLRLSPGLHFQLEALLQRYIVYQLERSLKSLGFLRTVRRLLSSSGQ
jgi:DNA repair protein RecO (recombination protein O)